MSAPRVAVSSFLLGLVLAMGAALAAEPIAVEHASGRTLVPSRPAKIAVFDAASLDTLAALSVPVAAVATGRKPAYLAAFDGADVAKAGTVTDPDMAALATLAPDLIIIGGRTRPKYAELAAIAPTIDMAIDRARPYDSARERIALLGRIFGRDAQATALLDRIDATAAALRAKAGAAGTALLVLTSGEHMSAFGPGSRFGMLHDTFGLRPAVPDLAVADRGQPVDAAFIAAADPAWLFVVDRDVAIGRPSHAAALLAPDAIARSRAARTGRIVYLDAANWYLTAGGALALQASVNEVAKALEAAGTSEAGR